MTELTSFKAVNQAEWCSLQRGFKAACTQSGACSSECGINLWGSH